MWYRCQFVKCGKPGCRSCPHGPYWYGFYRDGGKMHSRYFGRKDPRQAEPQKPQEPVAPSHPFEAMLDRRTATLALAREILGASPADDFKAVQLKYRQLCLLHHPDRGGDVRAMLYVGAAWDYYKAHPAARR